MVSQPCQMRLSSEFWRLRSFLSFFLKLNWFCPNQGGIILGKYLSYKGEHSQISHAMIISAPFNPKHTMQEMEKFQNMFINRNVSNQILANILKYRSFFENDKTKTYDFDQIAKSKTMRDLDTHFHAIHFEYGTCDELYEAASLDAIIQNIRTPTVFLNAANDMFAPKRSIFGKCHKKKADIENFLFKVFRWTSFRRVHTLRL